MDFETTQSISVSSGTVSVFVVSGSTLRGVGSLRVAPVGWIDLTHWVQRDVGSTWDRTAETSLKLGDTAGTTMGGTHDPIGKVSYGNINVNVNTKVALPMGSLALMVVSAVSPKPYHPACLTPLSSP